MGRRLYSWRSWIVLGYAGKSSPRSASISRSIGRRTLTTPPTQVTPAVARWADVMTKLRLFQLTKYTKICFIDADTLVTGRLDDVFWDEATLSQPTLTNPAAIRENESALPRTYMLATHAEFYGYDHPYPPEQEGTYLNCGFFVFTPSPVLFDYYMSLLKLPGRFDTGTAIPPRKNPTTH